MRVTEVVLVLILHFCPKGAKPPRHFPHALAQTGTLAPILRLGKIYISLVLVTMLAQQAAQLLRNRRLGGLPNLLKGKLFQPLFGGGNQDFPVGQAGVMEPK